MDASEGASLGMGNTMMDEMAGENELRRRHNTDIDSQIQAQRQAVLQRVSGEKGQARREEAVGGSLIGTEGIARAAGVVRAGRKAASAAEAAGHSWSSMGLGEQSSRVMNQYAKDSEMYKVGKTALAPFSGAAGKVASTYSDVAKEGADITPVRNMAGPHAQLPFSGDSARSGMVDERAGFVARGGAGRVVQRGGAGFRAAAGARPATTGENIAATAQRLGSQAVESVRTADPLGAVASVAKSAVSGLASKAEAALPDEEAASTLSKGFTTVEKGAKGLGILAGGYDLVNDLASGKVVGHNSQEKSSNELGIASGVAEGLSFLVPGLGLIGAGLGLASGIEGAIGAAKEKKGAEDPGGELAQKEKSEQETGGSVQSLTGKGLVAEQETGAQQQARGGGTTAF